MKRVKSASAAIAFLKEIGARNVREPSQTKSELCRRFSREEAIEILERWKDIDKVAGIGEEDFIDEMEYLNMTYERSIGVALTLDYDLYRAEFDICEKAKELFGRNILEYGCRNGIQSCFLGRLLPDSKILSIDDCELGLKHAERFRDGLGITNVEFRKESLATIPKDAKYDTVVMTQTLQRNNIAPGLPSAYLTLTEEAELIREQLADYVDRAIEHVADGGHLVFMDYAHFGAELLSLVVELASRGFRWLDGPSERGVLISLYEHRVMYYAPHVLFFEKVNGKVSEPEMGSLFISYMIDDESKKIPGVYLDEAAQAQLQQHAGEIVAGFSATFEYEEGSPDVVAGLVFKDIDEEGVYWREMQTPSEICVCKYTNTSKTWVSNDVWADAQSVIRDDPDLFWMLTGTYVSINRDKVTDFATIPNPGNDPEATKTFEAKVGGALDLMSKFQPVASNRDFPDIERKTRRPGEALDDLINKLDSRSGTDDDMPRLRLTKLDTSGRKRKKRAIQVTEEPGIDVNEPVPQDTSPVASVAETNVSAAAGLKLTYFAKSGRLNVEDQSSGSQWCATGKGVTVDGEKVDSSVGVRIGETGLSVETTDHEIRLRDGNCGYRFTIKL